MSGNINPHEALEPAIYETPDVPEPDSDLDPPKYESEYIIDEALDAREARSTFENAALRNTRYPGHLALTYAEEHQETRDEKLMRLQRELEELRNEDSSDKLLNMLSDVKSLVDESQRPQPMLSPSRIASQISLETIEKMSLLESRLTKLERRIGSSTEFNLASQIATMRFSIAQITASPESIQEVTEKFQRLVARSAKLEDSEIMPQVQELFKSLQTINEVSPTLDLVIDRLRSLQNVHEDAASTKSDIDKIRSSLNTRSEAIAEWKSTLSSLEGQIKKAEDIMRCNSVVVGQMVTDLAAQLARPSGD